MVSGKRSCGIKDWTNTETGEFLVHRVGYTPSILDWEGFLQWSKNCFIVEVLKSVRHLFGTEDRFEQRSDDTGPLMVEYVPAPLLKREPLNASLCVTVASKGPVKVHQPTPNRIATVGQTIMQLPYNATPGAFLQLGRKLTVQHDSRINFRGLSGAKTMPKPLS